MSKSESLSIQKIKDRLTGRDGRRLDKERAAQAREPDRFRSPDSRRAAAKLLSPTRTDRATAKAFAALLAEDEARLAAALKKARTDAVRNSRTAHKGLKAQAASRVKALQGLVGAPAAAGAVQYELLNKPFLIWPSNSVDLEASEIVPSNSWAKFRARITKGKVFYGNVKFYYLWRNPRDAFAVINVDGYAIFHGYAYVGVGGGFFPGDRMAGVSVDGQLDILEWWNQPPTQPPAQPDQSVKVASLKVTAYGWSEVGAIDGRDIYRGYDLRHTLMIVPPSSVLVFTVPAAVTLGTGSDSGLAEIDFASGAFQVGSPAVLVAILS
jgi:hypothetical protein